VLYLADIVDGRDERDDLDQMDERISAVHNGHFVIDNIAELFLEHSQESDWPKDTSKGTKKTTNHHHSQLSVKS
jgi:hypothetical protein